MKKQHIGGNFDDFLRERVTCVSNCPRDQAPQADQVRDGEPHENQPRSAGTALGSTALVVSFPGN